MDQLGLIMWDDSKCFLVHHKLGLTKQHKNVEKEHQISRLIWMETGRDVR